MISGQTFLGAFGAALLVIIVILPFDRELKKVKSELVATDTELQTCEQRTGQMMVELDALYADATLDNPESVAVDTEALLRFEGNGCVAVLVSEGLDRPRMLFFMVIGGGTFDPRGEVGKAFYIRSLDEGKPEEVPEITYRGTPRVIKLEEKKSFGCRSLRRHMCDLDPNRFPGLELDLCPPQ
ncbi:MAG: hypothetical protein AAB408_03085 [Patescibacteria group bacterium]